MVGGDSSYHSDLKMIQVIDIDFPPQMQQETIKWLASIFRPFIIQVLNEPSRVEFSKLIQRNVGGNQAYNRDQTQELLISQHTMLDTQQTG